MADGGGAEILDRAPDLKIVRAPNPGPMTLDGTRTYVLGRASVVVIDPGPRDSSHLGAVLEAIGDRPVKALMLTHAHADHAGLSRDLASGLGCPIRASSATLARLGLTEEGEQLVDGTTVDVEPNRELMPLATPGHSRDHFCFLELPSRRLFTGDLVLGTGSSAILHPDGRVEDAMSSLARLAALRPSELLPGHGDPVEDAGGKLAEYRTHRAERGRQVERAVRSGLTSVPEIRRAVYGPLPPGLSRAADASVAAHLSALADAGRGADLVDSLADLDAYGLDEDDQ